MKKIMMTVLALSLALALTACGGDNNAPPLYAPSHVEKMAEAGAFSETLEELDTDTAFALYRLADYGLNREDLKESAALRSAGATCEEGAVLVFSDADKAKTAEVPWAGNPATGPLRFPSWKTPGSAGGARRFFWWWPTIWMPLRRPWSRETPVFGIERAAVRRLFTIYSPKFKEFFVALFSPLC